MRNSSPRPTQDRQSKPAGSITLKALAKHLRLSPTTVSLVINDSPVARSIPDSTKQRILDAAREFNYRANHYARSLRIQRSSTIGVLVPEISEGYEALVMSGIEQCLLARNYFYITVSHHHRGDLVDAYLRMLMDRGVEGIIAIDTEVSIGFGVPVVSISGQRQKEQATRVIVDHQHAADVALNHLHELGHRDIAIIKGQEFSSDTEVRWESIRNAAKRLGISIDRKLVAQLVGESSSPKLGYEATRQLLSSGKRFTALFAFNDVSAIGAVSALRESGLDVPRDVSVVGFDDIQSAAYQNPGLTTVKQPLYDMGAIAAKTVLDQISGKAKHKVETIVIRPELVVRGSTTAAPRVTGISRAKSHHA